MQTSKTFRLFISSTFSDFQEERKVLQTKVFPHIKEYASKQGYSFQPIDLRWGVSNEAQLDQKTLELCLNEVRACKTHMHPNFLIMLGDRYGWVPLPFAIEEKEFEKILSHVDSKEELREWYYLDENQLPASYVLKERTGKYEDYDIWTKVEAILRDTLQSAVNDSNISEEQRRKYFLSATEAEIEEGIVPYIKPTKFQTQSLNENDDSQYIFGLFRDVDKTTQVEDKFITDDYEEAQGLKKRVRDTILKDNTLHVETKQVSKDSLDTNYLKEFEERMLEFLKHQIDSQKQEEKDLKLTPLEIELQAQKYFAVNKRKNFLAQDELRQTITQYITGETQEPLVIYGQSGRGKSALMSKAIEEAENTLQSKVLYRFVGATPNSSSTKEILTSLFDELNIDIRSVNKEEDFEDFSQRVYSKILNIKENVVIFIDALDQLQNNDQFLWLPQTLPNNVKVVISALEDENYKEDSKYLEILKTKTTTLHKIPAFNESIKLLNTLLAQENRTIDDYQEKYFLKQYKNIQSPFYITIAIQEMKNWKSGDTSQDLEDTQQGIIKEFISNLSEFYHHDYKFVNKVIGYIYASGGGLSESTLLQLLDGDKEFVALMADETYHKNDTLELPLVHWSRLQTQLKPFLNSKIQDGEELMYFFHRAFKDSVIGEKNQIEEHEAMIKTTQALTLKNKDTEFFEDTSVGFYENRWGDLYARLITEYELNYHDKEKQIEFSVSIFNTHKLNEFWIHSYIRNLATIGFYQHQNNNMFKAIASRESCLYTIKELYKEDQKKLLRKYTLALNDLASSYSKLNRFDEAIELLKLSVEIRKERYKENPSLWAKYYTMPLNNLASSYSKLNRFDEAIELEELSVEIYKELYKEDPVKWARDYTSALDNLISSYKEQNRSDEVIELQKLLVDIYKKQYTENPAKEAWRYTRSLDNLISSYKEQNRSDEVIELQKLLVEIYKKQYTENPVKKVWNYIRALNNLATSYYNQNRLDEAIELQELLVEIYKELYKEDPKKWVVQYLNILMNLVDLYKKQNRFDEVIELQKSSLEIFKKFYKKDPVSWAENYTKALNILANSYYNQNIFDKAGALYKKSLEIQSELYIENSDKWVDSYVTTLNNLANSYYDQNIFDKAGELFKQSIEIQGKLYTENPDKWADSYVTTLDDLAYSYSNQNMSDKKGEVYKQSLEIQSELYTENPDKWTDSYVSILTNVAHFYYNQELYDKASELYKQTLEITSKLYKKEPEVWRDSYITSLTYLAYSYHFQNFFDKAQEIYTQILEIRSKLYKENSDKWVQEYITSLDALAYIYYEQEKFEKAIEIYKEPEKIISVLYKKDPDIWVKKYIDTIDNLAISYKKYNKLDEAIKLEIKVLDITKKLYTDNPEEWEKRYTNTLKKLITYYKEQNRKDETKTLEEELLKVEEESEL